MSAIEAAPETARLRWTQILLGNPCVLPEPRGRLRTRERVWAFDRRIAAAHEAGHVTVANYCGVRSACATIWPMPQPDPLAEKTAQGTCNMFMPKRTSRRSRMMIAVAGVVSESAWAARFGAGWPSLNWGDVLADPDSMSERDWLLAGAERGEASWQLVDAAERVATLVHPLQGPLWGDLCKVAHALARQGEFCTPAWRKFGAGSRTSA